MIVLHASAAVEWLLQSSAGQRIESRIYSRNESLHAPHLLDVEVSQVLRRLVRDKIVAEDRAGEAIEDLRDLRVARYPHSVMLPGFGSCATRFRPTTLLTSRLPKRSMLRC